jgi:hypothetical protein
MTIEEKIFAIEAFCMSVPGCESCPLYGVHGIRLGEENCFSPEGLPINIDRNYNLLFGAEPEETPEPEETSVENPYWKVIEALAEKQRAKGISKYGQGLEMNPMEIIERLTYLEEELVDGLFYIEHIKAWLKEKGFAE